MKKDLPSGKPLISATFGAKRPKLCCIKITKKIDLVITKSVSRSGRNTLDGIEYTRKLKRLGVGVYFEKEKPVYDALLALVRDKDYFVLTTNVDHQFQKAGFDKRRLFYTQGDYGLFRSIGPKLKKT